MNIVKRIIAKVNTIMGAKSHWYNDIMFPDCKKFWKHKDFDLELVNLGSTSAVCCFNYTELNVKAANWAMAPQSFVGDYAILTNYCSYLKKGATILIPLCPFSSLGGGNDDLADKYYTIVRPISIPHASLRRRNAILQVRNNPLRYFPLFELWGDLKAFISKSKKSICNDFEADADRWLQSWMKEFSLYKLDNPLSLINQDRYNDSVKALRAIISFCYEHEFRPVIVVPPISGHLSDRLSRKAKNNLIEDFILDSNTLRAEVLNYIDHPELSNDKYFRNAYLMNDEGAKFFSKDLLYNLNLQI